MREEVVTAREGDGKAGRDCLACLVPVRPGDSVVVCPRCKSLHHLACWVGRGGCAKHGCRQVASRDLLPPKEEKPIRPSPTPAWAIAAAVALVAALGVGLYFNARSAAERRMRTISVMIPSIEYEQPWQEAISRFNETAGGEKRAELILAPVGPTSPYEQKLIVMMAAQDGPEVAVLEGDRFRAYAEQGALLPLDQELARLEEAGIAFSDAERESVTVGAQVYGIPHPLREAAIVVPAASKHPEESRKLVGLIVEALVEWDQAMRP